MVLQGLLVTQDLLVGLDLLDIQGQLDKQELLVTQDLLVGLDLLELQGQRANLEIYLHQLLHRHGFPVL